MVLIFLIQSPDFDLPLSASRFPYGAQQGSHKFRKSQLESEWPSLGSNSGKASSPGAKKRQLSKLPSFAAVSKPMTKPKPSESPVESNYDQVTFRLAIVIAVYLKRSVHCRTVNFIITHKEHDVMKDLRG